MSKDEILAELGPASHSGTLTNYLGGDPRFSRTSLTQYALREWDLEEYTGIVDEITQEIDVQHLVSTLTNNFGVSEHSVRAYAAGPHFASTRRGAIRVSTDPSQALPQKAIDLTRRCFNIGGDWGVRMHITADLLRGSGTPLPAVIARHVGLAHGGERTFSSAFGPIRITWPSLQVTVGSLRSVAEGLGGQIGDLLFLFFGRQVVRLVLIEQHALRNLRGLDRLAAEVGLTGPIAPTRLLATIADAVGLASTSTIEEVRTRLLDRGEDALAGLLPTPPVEAAEQRLERLTAVLGRVTGWAQEPPTEEGANP